MATTAVIAGVGPGLGAALARKFCAEGCRVALLARTATYLKKLVKELTQSGAEACGVPVDLTQARQVERAFRTVRQQLGPVDTLVCNASQAVWSGVARLTPAEFERTWRCSVLTAFLSSREALRDMVRRRAGTIIFTGATSSVRGRKDAADFCSAKFGLRGLAESMAREFWPRGIHVAHVVIDGMIDTPAVRREFQPGPGEPLLKPDAIAAAYWHLAQQDKSAWTLELDLRPNTEEFFV